MIRITYFVLVLCLLSGCGLSGSFSKFVWGYGIARNGSTEYNLQHLMTQECGDVWTHTEISTNFYN